MPPKGHAAFSPSSAARLISCPPSLRLGERYPDESSAYAEEGTQAHAYCEFLLRRELGESPKEPELSMFGEEMREACEAYRGIVMEAKGEDGELLIEQSVSFTDWVEDGHGTSDAVVLRDGVLTVIDYKHGQGVKVSAENNAQARCYALGALQQFGPLYDFKTVRMCIVQPRLGNVSTAEMSVSELLEWAEGTLKPAAKLALAGEGEFSAGAWCRFCKARNECRARAEANLMEARHEFMLPETLQDAEMEALLPKLDGIEAWVKDIREHALRKALEGKIWKGWKLVEGRSNRRYRNAEEVAKIVWDAGYDPYEKNVLGITAMAKLLGKARFNELLDGLIVKPKGKPTLVPDGDERPAMDTPSTDFKE